MTFLSAAILAVAALITPEPPALALQSGLTMPVVGRVEVVGETVIFRRTGGTLYSLPVDEIDFDATNRMAEEALRPKTNNSNVAALKVSPEERDRLLKELQKSKAKPAPAGAQPQTAPPPAPPVAEPVAPPQPSVETKKDTRDEERYWRNRYRAQEENIRQRQEELQYLIDKEQRLEDQILGFLSLGYKPNEFSYQVLQLERAREGIERARMDLERANRAMEQLLDEARLEGAMPGWLR